MRGVDEKCLDKEAIRRVAVDVLETAEVEDKVTEFAAVDMRLNIPNARIDLFIRSGGQNCLLGGVGEDDVLYGGSHGRKNTISLPCR